MTVNDEYINGNNAMWTEDYLSALSYYEKYIKEYENIIDLKSYRIYYNSLIAKILTGEPYYDNYN